MIRGTFNRTLYGTLFITACATVLTACGGSDGSSMPGNDANDAQRQSLLYAYPDDGQSEVAIPAPVVLRFTSDIELAAAENNIKLRLGGADGDIVPVTYSKVEADGRSILLTPTEKLQPLTEYTVTLRGVQLSVGKAPNQDIHFTTRALQRGPKSLVVADDDFTLTRAIPSGDVEEPVMDFSTFRFQFTQPIDPTSARYGLNPGDGTTPADTVALVNGSGELVEARLLTEGPYMTLDPAPEHLTPGETYTLTLGDGLASTFGNTFGGHELTVTPQDSSPRGEPAILVQRITDSENRTRTSPLTGKPVNEVPVNATLLGQDNVTQASGDVRAELGDVTVYTDVTPVRIPADTILSGTSLDVLIGGEVPAGFESGEVKMHFLSDATGYLVPNPYDTHNRADALRIVRLFMDVAITTDEARANGGFTQDMLHIELIGVGEVDPQEGVLKIDAVSVVEPDVLGQEFAHGMLSFQLESYKDQLNAPAPVPDTTPLEFQSWTLGVDGQTGLDKTAMFKPTDPIVLNFTRPLDRQSVTGKVHLYKNEGGVQTEVDSKVTVDGAAIVIKPVDPLEHPTETGPSLSYQVSLDPGIMDLRGEPWVGSFDEVFSLRTRAQKRDLYRKRSGTPDDPWQVLAEDIDKPLDRKSPFLLAVYPGFPCAMETADQDLAAGISGRCKGGIQPHSGPGDLEPLPFDDFIPVSDMPANRPIIVVFSKTIDAASIEIGRTFKVFEIDTEDQIITDVEGTLSLTEDILRFTPSTPWKKGVLYRYEVASNGDIDTPSENEAENNPGALCDISTMVCSEEGLPLQTQLLAEISIHDVPDSFNPNLGIRYLPHFIWEEKSPSLTGGGPDLVQYFRGTPGSQSVLQLLRLADSMDANANLVNDSSPEVMGPPPIYTFPSTGLRIVAGSSSYNQLRLPSYTVNETDLIIWQPDPTTADLVDRNGVPMDPNGVKPPPNSAKILSRDMGDRSLEEVAEKGYSINGAAGPGVNPADIAAMSGLLVGCGYAAYEPYADQTGCDVAGELEFFPGFEQKRTCYQGVPAECPRDKFTYLNGALFAEVSNDPVANGVKVLIHPGHMVTTSFRTFMKGPLRGARGENVANTGYQLMRMRYVDGAPIEALIEEGLDGPELNASVPLYMDAPYLVTDIVERKRLLSTAHHNLYSYPVEMSLSGPISFLDDGRMIAEQWNLSDLVIEQRVNAPALSADLIVPAGGTHIRYISESIK
ncbi:hypothetical protein MA04_03580 [Alcanivorax balearicus MACL04]|uniref:SbsA Ig-like domain-containing protein n=1 Tax=Alloalcanivorax balearicus MACL04 TaxID=1177182 RepID=A0ABT2R3C1_9GAMM|nr:Ig-like domain-containing protein [Alloalcanivorax balearicus]MCU5784280.1 hypothetical protein [Alloalcanivorax balearicus MACL04]